MDPLPLMAEFFGTFLLLIAIFTTGNALIIGLTLSFNVWLLGGVSGSHVNPAVSAAMWAKGSISTMELITYSVAQIAGAVAAYFAYVALA